MRVNHLIIGAESLSASSKFYREALGYRDGGEFVDTGTGREGVVLTHERGPELLIVPFSPERIPSPQHVAFEVDAAVGDSILKACRAMGLKVRAQASLESPKGDVAELVQSGILYRHFYVSDPTGLNLEVMWRA
jgi:catechol 2,3-dioxygenase-like lactoylglutathione lyase family enzyme